MIWNDEGVKLHRLHEENCENEKCYAVLREGCLRFKVLKTLLPLTNTINGWRSFAVKCLCLDASLTHLQDWCLNHIDVCIRLWELARIAGLNAPNRSSGSCFLLSAKKEEGIYRRQHPCRRRSTDEGQVGKTISWAARLTISSAHLDALVFLNKCIAPPPPPYTPVNIPKPLFGIKKRFE